MHSIHIILLVLFDEDLSWQYRYIINVTQFGQPCLPWSDAVGRLDRNNLPPTNCIDVDSFYPDKSFIEARNYCRNPETEASQVWCYTGYLWDQTGLIYGAWNFCSPPKCPNLGRHSKQWSDCAKISDWQNQYIPKISIVSLIRFVEVWNNWNRSLYQRLR